MLGGVQYNRRLISVSRMKIFWNVFKSLLYFTDIIFGIIYLRLFCNHSMQV